MFFSSVSIIIYNRTKHALVLVKQFRPGKLDRSTSVPQDTACDKRFPDRCHHEMDEMLSLAEGNKRCCIFGLLGLVSSL